MSIYIMLDLPLNKELRGKLQCGILEYCILFLHNMTIFKVKLGMDKKKISQPL
jgi:hypothetical protein